VFVWGEHIILARKHVKVLVEVSDQRLQDAFHYSLRKRVLGVENALPRFLRGFITRTSHHHHYHHHHCSLLTESHDGHQLFP